MEMKEKTIGILIHFDPEVTQESSGTVRTDDKLNKNFKIPGTDETYLVFMNNCKKDMLQAKSENEALLTNTAHELGHVLSSVFNIPGGMQDDPRSQGAFVGACCSRHAHPTPEQMNAIQRNERLAWKIARKIEPSINPASEAQALSTYNPDSPNYGGVLE